MKRIILLIISIYFLEASAQEIQKNSLSTSLIRLEKNSQTIYGDYKLKFMTGIEYQRFVNKWSFGIKYEHGFNKIEEYPTDCYDCFYGTGYMREDNIYLTTNYSIFKLFNSRLKLNTGVSLYYSNLNFSGDYQGGLSGGGTRENSTYNTFGAAPSLSILYYPIERLFISLNSNLRYGWSKELDANSNQDRKVNEFVITAPELKIGVNF
jgi:hypothetical protein